MGENSKVEWTDSSWSPWYGCHKVSQGCAHCYAYREMAKYGKQPHIVTRSKTTFRAPIAWAKHQANWGKKIFVCPWSDFWIEEADAWREEALEIMRKTPMFTYIVPSKRLERVPDLLPADWGAGWPHMWLGASIEDQAAADLRVPLLLEIPCKTRFLSCEPLLGELDLEAAMPYSIRISKAEQEAAKSNVDEITDDELKEYLGGKPFPENPDDKLFYQYLTDYGEQGKFKFAQYKFLVNRIHWVIAGGESGPDARPCHPAWVRMLRNQCEQAMVPFFFKSWGEYIPAEPPAEQRYTMPVEFIKVGRKQSGCMLDGREWHQYPSIE
jgi:protein gp37